MNSVERIIGKLEAHKESMETRLVSIESKVDGLLSFKWRVIGFSVAISGIVSIMIEVVRAAAGVR